MKREGFGGARAPTRAHAEPLMGRGTSLANPEDASEQSGDALRRERGLRVHLERDGFDQRANFDGQHVANLEIFDATQVHCDARARIGGARKRAHGVPGGRELAELGPLVRLLHGPLRREGEGAHQGTV
jgi:hypothetical protein